MKKCSIVKKALCVSVGVGVIISQYIPNVHAFTLADTTKEKVNENTVELIQKQLASASHISDAYKEQIVSMLQSIPKYYHIYYKEESRSALENTLTGLLQKVEDPSAIVDDNYMTQLESELQAGVSALVYKTSSVPQIFITTADGKGNELEKWTVDEDGNEVEVGYKNNTEIAAVPEEGSNDSLIISRNDIGIKVRGNTTALGKKKPYNLKFPEAQSAFGMELSKTWALLANHFDPTLLRSYIVFEFAKNIGLEYTPSQQFVELWIDGVYKGTYTLMERAVDKVDLQEGSQDFVIELDSKEEPGEQYVTTSKGIRFRVNRPSKMSDEQLANVRTILQDIETAMDSGDYNLLCEKIDVDSFAKYYVLNEYWKTFDIQVSSVFFYYKNGKLYAGPIWDYDLSAGNVNGSYANYHGQDSTVGLYAFDSVWYPLLFKYEGFYNQVMNTFQTNQSKMKELYEANGKIDQALTQYRALFDKNYTPVENGGAGWDITYANDYIDFMYRPFPTYDEDITYFRNWLQKRYEWMENNLSSDLQSKIEYNNPEEGPTSINIQDCTIALNEEQYVYDGTAKEPAVTVSKDGQTLVENTDYTVSYTNNINAGSATVEIRGIGAYTGVVTKNFLIQKANQTMSVTASKDTITVGERATIQATSTIANPRFTYTSSDENIVTITQDGIVVGKKVGQASITITALETENYNEASQTIDVTVTAASLADYNITLSDTHYVYDGNEKTPTVNIEKDGIVLEEGVDYQVNYENNVDAGEARVNITGIGNYTGSINQIFIIAKAEQAISIHADKETIKVGETTRLTIDGAKGALSYETSDPTIAQVNANGEVIGQLPGVVTIRILAAETNNYNAAVATITISVTALDPIDITAFTTTLDKEEYVYDGTAKEPVVRIENQGKVLTQDSDYTVTYRNNTNAGNATVEIRGIGAYTGVITKDFVIKKADQTIRVVPSKDTIMVEETAALVVEGAKGQLSYQSADETIAVVDDKGNVTGIAQGSTHIYVRAASTANYHEATQMITINVTPKNVVSVDIATAHITLAIDQYVYDGSEKTPTVKVEKDGVALEEGKDYQVSYENNKNAGEARVIVTGMGNYTGSVTRNFTIAKGQTSLTIEGTLDKVYDGQPVQIPSIVQVGSQAIPTYTWYVKEDTTAREERWVELKEAPKEVGTYKLVINVQEDTNYVGIEEEIIFQITENTTTPEIPPIEEDKENTEGVQPPQLEDKEDESLNQENSITGVQTGDTSQAGFWMMLVGFTITVLGSFIRKAYKK